MSRIRSMYRGKAHQGGAYQYYVDRLPQRRQDTHGQDPTPILKVPTEHLLSQSSMSNASFDLRSDYSVVWVQSLLPIFHTRQITKLGLQLKQDSPVRTYSSRPFSSKHRSRYTFLTPSTMTLHHSGTTLQTNCGSTDNVELLLKANSIFIVKLHSHTLANHYKFHHLIGGRP